MHNDRNIPINSYCRKLGFGWTVATDKEEVLPPTQPQFTGTIRQIRQAQRSDPQYQADLKRVRCERWFHDGREIQSIQQGLYGRERKDPAEIDASIRSLDNVGAFISVKSQ